MKSFHKKIFSLLCTLMALCCSVAFSSCESVYDDLEACPTRVRLRFTFDYNMEFANSFHTQVDCLTVYVYDDSDHLVKSYSETSDILQDESWRLIVDLPAGTYKAVAYGGIECDDAKFAHNHPTPTEGHKREDLRMMLTSSDESDQYLHDLYYGSAEFEITDDTPVINEYEVPMMRDTNHFRIMLQHLSGQPIDGNDFIFTIEDDNALFNHDNTLLSAGITTYTPWNIGSVSTEDEFDTGSRAAVSEITVGFAELSTSRLTAGRESARLKVKSKDTGDTIIDIPLYKYLAMFKSQRYSNDPKFKNMSTQEFLDRQSQWPMIFLLDQNNAWINTEIIVDHWIVRINNIGLE